MADEQNPYDKVYDNLFNAPAPDMAARDPLTPAPPPAPAPPPDLLTSPSADPGALTDGETTLREALKQGMEYNPDQAAKALPVAQANQIPLDMAARNPDLQKDMDFNNIDFQSLNRDYPKLADFFRDPNNAAVAHDDIGVLTRMSDLVDATAGSFWMGVNQTIGGIADIPGYVHKQGWDKPDSILGSMFPGIAGLGQFAGAGDAFTSEITDPIQKFLESKMPEGAHKTIATDVAGLLGMVLPTLAAGPVGMPAIFAAQGFDQQRQQAEVAGATDSQTVTAMTGGAAIQGLAGELRLGAFFGKIPIISKMIENVPTAIRATWAKQILASPLFQKGSELTAGAAAGAGIGAVQTLLTNLVEHYTYNPDKKIMEGLQEQSEVGGTAGAIMQALSMAIMGRGMPKGDFVQPPPGALQAALKAQADLSTQSALRERSPETFHKLMGKLYPDRNLYIPVEDGIKFFQGQDEKTQQEITKNMPDLAARANESIPTGADIPMTMADYLTWLAPHDTAGHLSKAARIDPLHEPVDVAAMYPELLDMVPKEEKNDPAAQALETRLTREGVAGGLSQHEAEAWASAMRSAYSTMIGKGEESGAHFAGLGVNPQNVTHGVSDDGLNFSISKMKARIRQKQATVDARNEREVQANKSDLVGGKVAKKKEKANPTPVINYIAERGGILRGSAAAKELAHLGITGDTHPRLFSAKGKFKDIDNIPLSEFNLEMHEKGLTPKDDGHDKVDPAWLYDQMQEEAHGRGHLTPEDAARDEHNEYLDRFEAQVEKLGLNPATATNAEIKSAIARERAGLGVDHPTELAVKHATDEVAKEVAKLEKPAPEFKPKEKPAPIREEPKEEPKAEEVKPEEKKGEEAKDTPAEKAQGAIEDFGEKIAGAKKDLWKDYKKSLSDALPEDAQDITLSKHFPEPDYEALIAQGVDVKVLSAIKAMRDEIPAKPRMKFKLSKWAEAIRTVRGLANSLLEGTHDTQHVIDLMKGNYALRNLGARIEMYAELGYPDFLKAGGYSVGYGEVNERNAAGGYDRAHKYTVDKDGRWLESFKDKGDAYDYLRKRLSLEGNSTARTTKLDLYQITKSGEIIIGKKVGAGKYIDLKGGFTSAKEAREYLKENEKALLVLLEKKKDVRPERRSANDPRKGEDYRMGEDVTPERFASEFGFRGVQFGNYVEQGRRVKDLNNAYDALLDMSHLLNIPERAISLNGTLGLAFGARGSGGKDAAAAHYEPTHVVINLTKTGGAGSLGHEWWHALDNTFGERRSKGTYLTDNPNVKKVPGEGKTLKDDDRIRPEVVQAFKGVMDAIKGSGLAKRSRELDKRRTKDYWSTDIEMSARAFEAYLIHKAAEKGESNDYLANIVDEKTHAVLNEMTKEVGMGDEPFPYPTSEEMKTIAPAFDRLFQTLKTRETAKGTEFFQSPSRPEITSTPEFKKWFKDSKVVDGKGKPIVVYHGTTTDFEHFDTMDLGSWFGESPETAQNYVSKGGYTEQQIYPVYLRAEKPLLIPSDFDMSEESKVSDLVKAINKENSTKFSPKDLGLDKDYTGNTYEHIAFTTEVFDALKAKGFDSIYAFEEGKPTWNVFEPEQIKSIHNRGSFDGNEKNMLYQGGNRGSITFTPDARSLISLFQNRDKSTILHETGHFFLNVLRNSTSPQLRALWDKTKGWWSENHAEVYKEAQRYNPYQVGQHALDYHAVTLAGKEVGAFDTKKAADEFADAKHKEALAELERRGGKDYVKRFIDGDMEAPDDVDQMVLTAMDEQFARAHEAYLMDGKAPSEELRTVFRRFTAWLAKIYGSIRNLNVNMTPEIRDVFDRIYASDDAIDAAKHIQAFKADPNIMAMMTTAQKAAYVKQQQEREDAARERTVRRALRDADKTTKDWWKSETETREKALREQYLRQPDYAAAQRLKDGKLEDGTPVKLDREAVKAKYGDAVVKSMDKKFFGPDGSDPDLIADTLGYDTGDDLVVALTRLDNLDNKVKEEARAQMVQEHGDVFLNGQLEELAVRNMLASEAEGLIEKEMAAAERAAGEESTPAKPAPKPSGKDFKKAAKDAVATMPVTAALKPNRFLQGLIRSARNAAKALAKKDYEEYAAEKRKELFALHMFRETRTFKDQHEKAIDFFNRVLKKPKKQKQTVDPEFRRAAWGVLGNFMASRADPLKLADLREIISQNISSEFDTPVVIPPEAETAWNKKSFKDMTVGEFNAVRDVVQGLITYGHNKQTLLIDGEKKEFNEIMAKVQGIVGAEKNNRLAWSRNAAQKFVDGALSTVFQADTFLELMDKGDKTGFMQRLMKRPLDLGRSREIDRSKQVYDDLHKIFTDSYSAKELKAMTGLPGNFDKLGRAVGRKTIINGRSFTHEERLAYLLNQGNEGNREAVDEGMGWKDTERQAMMATFEKKDYDFAQKIGDYIGKYWPEIAALEEKRYGFAPERVEASPLQTPYGEYRGWYYPIKWDGSKNKRAQEFNLEQELKGYIGYASTATKRGHTNERVGANKLDRMPVNLSFSVITSHLQAVIHDLEMGPAIQQTAKIMRDTRFKNEFIDRFGSDAFGSMDLWLKDIASGHIRSGSWPAILDTWARRNAQVATMALNSTTIMSHPGRLMNSVEGLGGGVEGMRALGEGFRQQFTAMRSPAEYKAMLEKISQKSGLMKSRVDTLSREMMEAKQHYSSDPLDTHAYRRALLAPIALMQVHAVDVSTWLGAYDKALRAGGADPVAREREAVFYADQVVRKYQGSGLMEDMSGLLRGTLDMNTRQAAWVKTLTFAHSFFNNKLNRIYLATKLADLSTWGGRYKYARSIITMSIMDALITDLLLQRMPGQTGEDDKKKVVEGWGWWMANRGLELLPLARDAERWLKGEDTGTPAEAVAKAVGGMFSSVEKDKEDRKELEAIDTGVGMLTGLVPSVELNRVIDLINRANEGKPIEYKDFVRTRRKNEK